MSLQVYSFEPNVAKFRPLVAGAGVVIDTSSGSIVVSASAAETSGIFNPGIGDGTFPFTGVAGAGSWTRVGNLISFHGSVQWSGLGSAVGPVLITGLPATPVAPSAAITLGEFGGIIYNTQVLATQGAGASFLRLVQADKTGGAATTLNADTNFAANGSIFFSGTYYAA
jgi:hypothetical protein